MHIRKAAVLLRIFVGETQMHKGVPLYEAIVKKAYEMHLAGATVVHGKMGFGRASPLDSAKILGLSKDLPVIIEVVDAEDTVNAFLHQIGAMIGRGLVTMENVRVVEYRDDV